MNKNTIIIKATEILKNNGTYYDMVKFLKFTSNEMEIDSLIKKVIKCYKEYLYNNDYETYLVTFENK